MDIHLTALLPDSCSRSFLNKGSGCLPFLHSYTSHLLLRTVCGKNPYVFRRCSAVHFGSRCARSSILCQKTDSCEGHGYMKHSPDAAPCRSHKGRSGRRSGRLFRKCGIYTSCQLARPAHGIPRNARRGLFPCRIPASR